MAPPACSSARAQPGTEAHRSRIRADELCLDVVAPVSLCVSRFIARSTESAVTPRRVAELLILRDDLPDLCTAAYWNFTPI
jgi:hypothetical protein